MTPTALLLLQLLATALRLAPASAATCHPDDEAGLLSFKSAVTADPKGLLSTWKAGTDCCAWNGITCLTGSRVTAVSIYGNASDPSSYLSGTIPDSLARLRKLDGFYLMDIKDIHGPFPSALLRLPNLKFIYIRNAKLAGPIPDLRRLADTLGVLDLQGNRFDGPIPNSVGKLAGLTALNLARNRLTGGVPSSIGQLRNLSQLALNHNELSGTIPDLSALTSLYILRLSYNKLAGEIPASLAALAPQLGYLELGHNALSGRIPGFLGRFTAMDTLDLSSNRLTGPVPASFKNLTKIFNLDLSGNALVDPFPAMSVKGIESLDLSHNKFHLGKIPPWVASSPIIYSLKLAGCGIKMKMEDFIPEETYFYDFIDLSDNEISGSPAALLNRTELLVEFRAAGNKLKFDMTKLPRPVTLRELDLSRNMVYGMVPPAVAGLKELNVSDNRLCGRLPKTTFPASAFAGNACLCGAPLSPCRRRLAS